MVQVASFSKPLLTTAQCSLPPTLLGVPGFQDLKIIRACARQDQRDYLCAQRTLRSAWTGRYHGSLAIPTERTEKTGRMPTLICVIDERTSFCWFCRALAKRNKKTSMILEPLILNPNYTSDSKIHSSHI